jgi:phosphoenolpyruvate carboxykinase (GTP)
MGEVGVVRRDPMAMKPFAGYNFGDYWQHWLNIGAKLKSPPAIFHVNWFRQGADGKFLWPGFGDNLRVMEWMIERSQGRAQAQDTPIGYLPRPENINTQGLNIDAATITELTSVKTDQWRKEMQDLKKYFAEFGSRAPKTLVEQVDDVAKRLG